VTVILLKYAQPGLKKDEKVAKLGHALAGELAPALFEAPQGLASGRLCAGRAPRGGLAVEAVGVAVPGGAAVPGVDHVAGASPADMVDGGDAAHLALELLVEAEDGALAGAVDVAGAAAAGGESAGDARVEAR